MTMHYRSAQSLGILLSIFLLTGCVRSPSRSGGNLPSLEHDEEPQFLEESVSYCRSVGEVPTKGKVLIALDASGSMVGHRDEMPQIVHWFQQSLSRVRDSTLEPTESPLCFFNDELGGLGDCRDLDQPLTGFIPRTDTVLHLAIDAAAERELTLILTDGVANARVGGSGDCASGVDAACVARSLRRVLSHQDIDRPRADWGLWILPIVTDYNGPFYTEQQVNPSTFEPKTAVSNIQRDLGGDPRILNARSLTNKTLTFEYSGPRSLILMVLARDAEIGRSAVEALMDRAEHSGLVVTKDFHYVDQEVAVQPPIEVYPGMVNRVEWTHLEPWPTEDIVGTLDYELDEESYDAVVRLRCPLGVTGEGLFHLAGRVPGDLSRAGCVDLDQLPAVRYALGAASGSPKEGLDLFLPGYRRTDASSHAALDVHLRCQDRQTDCSQPVRAEWRAEMHYAEAADCLAGRGCASRVPDRVVSLSTTTPPSEPHKIFGFAETLEELYRLSSNDAGSQLVGAFEICRATD